MAIPLQKGQEKVKGIKVEGGREKEKEVVVCHEIVSLKRKVNVELTWRICTRMEQDFCNKEKGNKPR